VLHDYAVTDLRFEDHDMIRLDKDDFPPIYLPVSSIEFLELSNG
jgi:hypothetical protein